MSPTFMRVVPQTDIRTARSRWLTVKEGREPHPTHPPASQGLVFKRVQILVVQIVQMIKCPVSVRTSEHPLKPETFLVTVRHICPNERQGAKEFANKHAAWSACALTKDPLERLPDLTVRSNSPSVTHWLLKIKSWIW